MHPVKSSRRTKKQRTYGLQSSYPNNWDEIALAVKDAAENRCVRCGHPNDKPFKRWTDHGHEQSPCDLFCTQPQDGKQRMLTVHHLDLDKGNCESWNLIALWMVCHWRIHARVDAHQLYMFDHAEWIRPHIEAFLGQVTWAQEEQVGTAKERASGPLWKPSESTDLMQS